MMGEWSGGACGTKQSSFPTPTRPVRRQSHPKVCFFSCLCGLRCPLGPVVPVFLPSRSGLDSPHFVNLPVLYPPTTHPITRLCVFRGVPIHLLILFLDPLDHGLEVCLVPLRHHLGRHLHL